MAEPSSSTAAAGVIGVGLVALFGPDAPDLALVVISALFGSMWPVGRLVTPTRIQAAMVIVKYAGTSLALTGAAVWWVQSKWGVTAPTIYVSCASACVIAGLGDRIMDFISSHIDKWSAK